MRGAQKLYTIFKNAVRERPEIINTLCLAFLEPPSPRNANITLKLGGLT